MSAADIPWLSTSCASHCGSSGGNARRQGAGIARLWQQAIADWQIYHEFLLAVPLPWTLERRRHACADSLVVAFYEFLIMTRLTIIRRKAALNDEARGWTSFIFEADQPTCPLEGLQRRVPEFCQD